MEYGDERDPKMREFLERIAPANKAKNITKPLVRDCGQERSARAGRASRSRWSTSCARTARRCGG